MTDHGIARGGATVGLLDQVDPWHAHLVLNLRLWCTGHRGRQQVCAAYHAALPGSVAQSAFEAFDLFLTTILSAARRPLMHHDVNCRCLSADERVVLTLVMDAAGGHLNDAALIASMIARPALAEHIAILAGQVGENALRFQAGVSAFEDCDARMPTRLN